MIAVTGAARVFSRLPACTHGNSRAFASGERTNSNRAGEQLAEVGAIFSRSYRRSSSASVTGWSRQPFCVRASRNSWCRAAVSIVGMAIFLGVGGDGTRGQSFPVEPGRPAAR